jgi:hypothetical protein
MALSGVEILDDNGMLKTVRKATLLDYDLEERILQAAGM